MTVINPHIMNAIATERMADLRRAADLRRGAAPRPEETLRANRTRRLKRLAMRIRVISTVRPQQP